MQSRLPSTGSSVLQSHELIIPVSPQALTTGVRTPSIQNVAMDTVLKEVLDRVITSLSYEVKLASMLVIFMISLTHSAEKIKGL